VTKKGDEEAFAAIYYCFAAGLILYARARLLPLEDAHDIVPDVFLKFWHDRYIPVWAAICILLIIPNKSRKPN